MQMWMLGGAFALVGVPFVWLALRTFARDRAIERWPRVPGQVKSSSLEETTSRSKDEDGHVREYTLHRPVVRYCYTIGGKLLEGDRVARTSIWTDRASAQACLDRYPAGQEVQVLHDPEDPGTAYLEVQRSTGAVILLVFGGLWLAIGALLIGLWLASK